MARALKNPLSFPDGVRVLSKICLFLRSARITNLLKFVRYSEGTSARPLLHTRRGCYNKSQTHWLKTLKPHSFKMDWRQTAGTYANTRQDFKQGQFDALHSGLKWVAVPGTGFQFVITWAYGDNGIR